MGPAPKGGGWGTHAAALSSAGVTPLLLQCLSDTDTSVPDFAATALERIANAATLAEELEFPHHIAALLYLAAAKCDPIHATCYTELSKKALSNIA